MIIQMMNCCLCVSPLSACAFHSISLFARLININMFLAMNVVKLPLYTNSAIFLYFAEIPTGQLMDDTHFLRNR